MVMQFVARSIAQESEPATNDSIMVINAGENTDRFTCEAQ